MKKEKLIKISAQFHKYVRHAGCVEILEERYADPRKPNLCKLWVINGVHEFKQRGHARTYMSMLADRVGGDQKLTNDTYKAAWNNVIPTYSEIVRNAAILG
jgi:hypothetical protein